LKLALTAKNFNSPNKNSNERGKTSIHRTKLKQAVQNLNPPTKAQTNGEERQTTDQNFERTVKNTDTPNGNSNERWKTPKMVAPAHNHTRISESSRTHAVDGEQVLHGPRWAPDDPAG